MLTELDFFSEQFYRGFNVNIQMGQSFIEYHKRRLKRHIRDQVLIMASFRSAKWSFLFHNSYIHILDVHMCYSKHKLS